MINHVRTLLMNQPSGRYKLTDPGEEYIELLYQPRVLSPAVQAFFTALFGGDPDRVGINYRMRQIMQLLHASELSQDVVAKDSRITYLPFSNEFFSSVFKQSLSWDTTPYRVEFIGTHVADAVTGRLQKMWDIRVDAEGGIQVVTFGSTVETVDVPDPSQGISLPTSSLRAFIYSPTTPSNLRITSIARPAEDVITMVLRSVSSAGPRLISAIFPVLSPEPVATWQQIWQEHPDTATRCAALLLAIAHHVENL